MNNLLPTVLTTLFILQITSFILALISYLKNAKAYILLQDINRNFAVSLFSYKNGMNDLEGLWSFLVESAFQKVFAQSYTLVRRFYHNLNKEFHLPDNQKFKFETLQISNRLAFFFYHRLNQQAKSVFFTRVTSVVSSFAVLAQSIFSSSVTHQVPELMFLMAINILFFSTSQIFINQQVAFKIVSQLKKNRVNLEAWSSHSDDSVVKPQVSENLSQKNSIKSSYRPEGVEQ